MSDFGFNTFGEPELSAMLTEAQRFWLEIVNGRCTRWLSLLGPSGTGKTYLASRVCALAKNECLERWRRDELPRTLSFRSIKFGEFLEKCRARDYDTAAALGALSEHYCLLVDEISADRDTTGFAAELLWKIASFRVGKATMFTSNKSLESLGRIDARIKSRIIRDGNVCVELPATVPDYWERE